MTFEKATAQDTGMLTELRIAYLQEDLGEIEDAKAENVSNMEFLFIVVWAGVVLCEPIAYLESQLCFKEKAGVSFLFDIENRKLHDCTRNICIFRCIGCHMPCS